jgi:hypothetical protein
MKHTRCVGDGSREYGMLTTQTSSTDKLASLRTSDVKRWMYGRHKTYSCVTMAELNGTGLFLVRVLSVKPHWTACILYRLTIQWLVNFKTINLCSIFEVLKLKMSYRVDCTTLFQQTQGGGGVSQRSDQRLTRFWFNGQTSITHEAYKTVRGKVCYNSHGCFALVWPRGPTSESAAVRLLGLRVRIPPVHFCLSECCVLCCRGLCDEPIPRSRQSYRACVFVLECYQMQ